MSLKVYTCALYPQLAIAGVCRFVDGVFDTDNPEIQAVIERTDSFRAGLVKVLTIDSQPPPGEAWERPTKTAVAKMKKSELEAVAIRMGLEFDPNATRAAILTLVLQQYDE